MNSAILQAAKDMGILVVHVVTDPKPRQLSLAEACAARGLNPASYKVPSKGFRAVERIIPGVADRESPSMISAKQLGANYHGNARKMYTRQSALNDAGQIADGGIVAYIAAFNRLNNLKD